MAAQTGRVFQRAYPGLRSRLHRSLTLGCIAKAPSGLPITGLTAEQNRYWIERPDFGILAKTKQRKKPLAVHVFDFGMVILNKTCRFCPACDLLIAHRNEIDAQLAQLFANLEPRAVGNDYLVVGTVEREDWRRGLAKPVSNAEMLAALHDFQDHQNYERVLPGQDIPRGEGPPNPR